MQRPSVPIWTVDTSHCHRCCSLSYSGRFSLALRPFSDECIEIFVAFLSRGCLAYCRMVALDSRLSYDPLHDETGSPRRQATGQPSAHRVGRRISRRSCKADFTNLSTVTSQLVREEESQTRGYLLGERSPAFATTNGVKYDCE
jgi:hypothetical protein